VENHNELVNSVIIEKNLSVKTFQADFEKAAHIAVLQSFPQYKIICFTFHLGQNWYRRLERNKILLKNTRKMIRKSEGGLNTFLVYLT